MNKPKAVVMGGGTGTFTVVSALKYLNWDITTIIAVSDSGGSTGRIRDEFGFQPVGDLRQSLAALADIDGQEWIQNILLYRFEKGTGLKGHNLGNLILTALQDMTGSTTKSLEIAEKVFNLTGTVIPVTENTVDLEIHYSNGNVVAGEHILDENPEEPVAIDHVALTPQCSLNPKAVQALTEADIIIIGPGDFYASIMATLVLPEIPDLFRNSTAKKVYIANLMTRFTQTNGMTTSDHLKKIEAALGTDVTHIVINSDEIPADALQLYASVKEYPVEDDMGENNKVLRAPLINTKVHHKKKHDRAYRSLLRHDYKKLAAVLKQIME
ncbi:YvcK family protein [Candidatus Woesebacteria bacterium]|nr:YvcK family protein [Candidatus Woesebacteria bacterium]